MVASGAERGSGGYFLSFAEILRNLLRNSLEEMGAAMLPLGANGYAEEWSSLAPVPSQHTLVAQRAGKNVVSPLAREVSFAGEALAGGVLALLGGAPYEAHRWTRRAFASLRPSIKGACRCTGMKQRRKVW